MDQVNPSTHDFTHLHVHSDASLIDGLGPVARLVDAAKSLGFSALGLTDHGTLANTVSFTMECKHHGIKSLIGMEAYVTRSGERFHLTLLADGNRGFSSLVALNNAGQRGTDPTRPSFPIDLLHKHADGLYVLTGCAASPFQNSSWEDARELGIELKSTFGNRLFAEMMFISAVSTWERSAKLAKDLKIPHVVTNDVHFPYPGDANAHQVLTQLKASFTYDSQQLFLAKPMDLELRVKHAAPEFMKWLNTGMSNAMKLANRLESPVFGEKSTLPFIPRAYETLATICFDQMRKFQALHPEKTVYEISEYHNRLKHELAVIKKLGFDSYFLILSDIITYAKKNDIRVGPGRGSGAGSLVTFLLAITTIDPIEYKLSFDRFLNYKRAEFPDIDTDFESGRRDEVLAYAATKWNGTPVATYSRFNHKSLVHDLSRSFRVPRDLDSNAADGGNDSDDFSKIVANYPGFKESYDAMLGQIRHKGQHAGGIVIVDKDIELPYERTSGGDLVVAWTEGEHRELTTAGIVKYDLLGLSALSILARLERKHGFRASEPVDDDPVFSIFQDGNTTGIFQFSGSQGIVDFTKRVQPRTFEDLVAINALYRPGALDSGAAQHFPEWRKKPRTLHPIVDDVLKSTAGIICYQEQFMEIYARITGGDMADADLARKVLAKARPGQVEWEQKMAELRMRYTNGADAQGLPRPIADKIWSEITTHVRYSFNRAHAVCYAQVAWEMAWWRYHYPTKFFAALLSEDRAEWQKYLFELAMQEIQIVSPSINKSRGDFTADDERVYLPLGIVKGMGEVGVKAIIDHQPFASVKQFAETVPKRAVNSKARRALWHLGAFRGIPGTYEDLVGKADEDPNPKNPFYTFTGLVLPTSRMVKAINKETANGNVAGVVASREVRTSKFGEYTVYHIFPHGAFWSRDITEIPVGMEITAKIQSKNGKLIKASELRY